MTAINEIFTLHYREALRIRPVTVTQPLFSIKGEQRTVLRSNKGESGISVTGPGSIRAAYRAETRSKRKTGPVHPNTGPKFLLNVTQLQSSDTRNASLRLLLPEVV